VNLHEALAHKVAGLPAGAWAAAVAGGLGVSYYLRHRASSSADYTDATIAPTTADTAGLGGAAVSDPSNPAQVSNPSPVGGPGTGAPIRNNNQWRQQMVKVMVGNGVSAIAAESAVHDFLAGRPLTAAEAAELNRAMATVGPAPSPPPRASVITPHKPPAHKPPKHPKHPKHPQGQHRVGGGATGSEPRPVAHKPAHHPIAHKVDKPARHHTHAQAHPHHRRDNGTHTNPGR
jgi:hypothetical protein